MRSVQSLRSFLTCLQTRIFLAASVILFLLSSVSVAQQFDEVTIRQRSAELASVQADVAVARARVRAEAVQILTADQQAKLKEIESQLPRGRGRRG